LSGAPEEFSPGAVSKLENHVIVLGYKLLGIYLVEKLKEMGLPYVVVVRDESLLPGLHKSHVHALGSPIAKSFETLKAAGAARATAIIATFDEDGDNLLVAMSARKQNNDVRMVTVVTDRDLAESAKASSDIDVVFVILRHRREHLAFSAVAPEMVGMFIAPPRAPT